MSVVRDDRIRVLIAGLSPLVQAMVEAAFEDDARAEIADADDLSNLGGAVRAARADVVVVPLDGMTLPEEARAFLDCRAHVRVLGLEERAGRASLYQLVPETRELGDLAPTELAEAIRAAVGAGRER